MSLVYSPNDWRYFVLQHNWGTSPEMKKAEKEYNAKYYQEHREEILKKLHERRRNGIANGSKLREERETKGRSFKEDMPDRKSLLEAAENDEFGTLAGEIEGDVEAINKNLSKHTEYSEEALDNIRKNNEAVRDNVKKLVSTVQDYVKANANKLSDDEIRKLYQDLDQQVALEQKRLIDLDSDEGKSYVNEARGESTKVTQTSKQTGSEKKTETETKTTASSSKVKESKSSSETKAPKKPSKWHDNTAANKAIDAVYGRASGSENPSSDDAATDFGEFYAEVTEEGYEFGDDDEALAAWKKFRTSVGLKNTKKEINAAVEAYNERMNKNAKHSYNDWRDYKLVHNGVHMEYGMENAFSANDWRYYSLAHSWGTKPEQKRRGKEYNHEYWEKNKEEIMKKRREKRRNGSDRDQQMIDDISSGKRSWKDSYGGAGNKYESEEARRKHYLEVANEKLLSGEGYNEWAGDIDDQNDANDKHTEYSKEVLENVRKNNEAVRENIRNLSKSIEDYVAKNADKLSNDDIAKLYDDLDIQVSAEFKRLIDLDSKEGRDYVDGLLGGSGSLSSKPKNSSGSSSGSRSTSSSSGSNPSSNSSVTTNPTNVNRTSNSSAEARRVNRSRKLDEGYENMQKEMKQVSGAKERAMNSFEDFFEWITEAGADPNISLEEGKKYYKRFRVENGKPISDKELNKEVSAIQAQRAKSGGNPYR